MSADDRTTLDLANDELMLVVDLVNLALMHTEDREARERLRRLRTTIHAQALDPAIRP